MKALRVIWMTLFTGLLSIAVIAQGADCPAIVQTTLDTLSDTCADTGRNQACYGNNLIHLESQNETVVEAFDQPGDTVALADIDKMTLTPLDEAADTWGVAMMKLQANIPDTLPGQNVTFLLFGDVEIDNAVTEDDAGFTPMQAFYFKSGVGDAACEEAPESGLLIQTPTGVEEVLLNINGANMSLGSTAFLQAGTNRDNPDEYELAVSVLEGEGMIETNGEISPIPAGSWVRIRTDRNHNVIDKPSEPKPYKFERHGKLPISLLERKFEIQQSLTPEQIAERMANFDKQKALEHLRELGELREPVITRQTITNNLNSEVTIHFGDEISVTIPAGSEQTVDVPRGRYTVQVCARDCIVIEEAPILRDRQRTLDRNSFRQGR